MSSKAAPPTRSELVASLTAARARLAREGPAVVARVRKLVVDEQLLAAAATEAAKRARRATLEARRAFEALEDAVRETEVALRASADPASPCCAPISTIGGTGCGSTAIATRR
jgi:Tfp pilus assembly protein PilX